MDKYKNILAEIIKGKTQWPDLKTELSKYNIHKEDTSAGKIFEVFTKYYFLTAPEHIGQYEKVWLYDDIPLKVKEKLDLGKVEHGIDLLLKSSSEEYIAVQCKFKNNESSKLSWSSDKIANLFAYCPKADGYIVFSNCADIDDVSKSRHDNFTFISIGDLLETEPSTFKNITSLLNDEKPKAKQHFIPKEHQREAIDKCVQRFNEGKSRGQLILPCGAGKTLTALWIKEELKSNNTLVLVPSLALLRQTKNEWAKQRKRSYQYLCVCSEKTIDKESDSIATRTFEIGGKVTTNPSEIISFLNRNNQEKVIFSTYQSLPEIIKSLKGTDINFDLVFCDEAHKTAGIDKGIFGLVHDNNQVPAKRRLYATATPRIIKESLKKKLEDDLQFSHDMGDTTTYGEEFYRMSFKDAIEKDILVDYKIIAIGVSDSKLASYINERRYIDKKVSIDEVANNYALDYIMKEYKANHALTFHSRVKLAETFSKRHSQLVETTSSFSVNGTQPTSLRNQILNEFKNAEKAVISNARCLTEGVDVPTIDLVYFSDPKNSKVDIIQAVGRALRKKVGKALGYVVVPIYHTDDEDLESSIKQSSFKNLIQVIRSLCDQDERLQDEINSIAIGKGQRNSSKKIDVISDKSEVIQLKGFNEILQESLFDQIIEKVSISWSVNFEKLQEFIRQNNKYPSEKGLDQEEKSLGKWISHQRNNFKKKILEKKRVAMLNDIRFIWDKLAFEWEINIEQLKKFIAQNNRYPSRASIDQEEQSLASWVIGQRQALKRNKLDKKRVNRLNKIDFIWNPFEKYWEDNFKKVKTFLVRNERFPLAHNNVDLEEKFLGKWVHQQRQDFKKNKLDKKKIVMLNELDFIWDPFEFNWENNFNNFTKFVKQNDRYPNKRSKDEKEKKLGFWIHSQRTAFGKKQIDEGKVAKLNQIDFIFDPLTSEWNNNFEGLNEFIRKNNKYPSEKGIDQEEKFLGKWVSTQRQAFKKNRLYKEKIAVLEEIGFKWSAHPEWNDNFEKLQEFIKQNDKYPSSEVKDQEEKKLGYWVSTQRYAFKKNNLDPDKSSKLNAIQFRWEAER